MVGTVLANVGLTGQIPDGADGWGSAMNLNTLLVDSLISQKALSNSITTPPVSPALGDVYIVPTGATGAWSAAVDKLAVWNSTAWVFITPKNGWRFYIVSSGDYYRYSGSAWVLNTSQPLNANLTAYAGLTLADDQGVYATGAGALSTYTLTAFGRSVAGAADAAAGRTLFGLGTSATINATSANTTSTIVQRDASGNFTAGTITAALTGNASTASTLQTSRTINGTSFNGSANIVTTAWGTARTITVGNTGKLLSGDANVSWTLTEIGAVSSTANENIDGIKTFLKPLKFASYTLATLPSAATYTECIITVTDATDGAKICRSDGTNWKILNTTVTVS